MLLWIKVSAMFYNTNIIIYRCSSKGMHILLPIYIQLLPFLNRGCLPVHSQVKWEVIKRKEVPKKVKPMPTAPLVLIWEMILVVTVACSTSARKEKQELQLQYSA